jgi:3'-phosphoadenosine 5'-phosphosulfate (PAPS) 3'-phosphatase
MLDKICQLARDAGDAIMQVYDGAKPMDVVSKADDSPVTAADIAAHGVILKGLQALTPISPYCQKRRRRAGMNASTGSVTGWSTRWMAPKSSSSVTVSSPSISP